MVSGAWNSFARNSQSGAIYTLRAGRSGWLSRMGTSPKLRRRRVAGRRERPGRAALLPDPATRRLRAAEIRQTTARRRVADGAVSARRVLRHGHDEATRRAVARRTRRWGPIYVRHPARAARARRRRVRDARRGDSCRGAGGEGAAGYYCVALCVTFKSYFTFYS